MIQHTNMIIYRLNQMIIPIMMMSNQRQSAIIEIKEKGIDAWIGNNLNTALLGNTSNYKNNNNKRFK